jgi:hypothetical protein
VVAHRLYQVLVKPAEAALTLPQRLVIVPDLALRTQIYTRENATEARLLREAPQYGVVHIASHAYVDTTFDAFSGLVLVAIPPMTAC